MTRVRRFRPARPLFVEPPGTEELGSAPCRTGAAENKGQIEGSGSMASGQLRACVVVQILSQVRRSEAR